MNATDLLKQAKSARERAYAPYSGFSVGAALLARNGQVFLGCNIENAAFSPTCCAERVAIFKAVSEGVRTFDAIAIVGGAADSNALTCTPCGVCRQVLSEFCDASLRVITEDADGKPTELTLGELLPHHFAL